MKKNKSKPFVIPENAGHVLNNVRVERKEKALKELLKNTRRTFTHVESVERNIAWGKYIDPKYNYSPTIEDFKEELSIMKMQPFSEYKLFLIKAKQAYRNSYTFYSIYGPDAKMYTRLELDGEILKLIESEIKK